MCLLRFVIVRSPVRSRPSAPIVFYPQTHQLISFPMLAVALCPLNDYGEARFSLASGRWVAFLVLAVRPSLLGPDLWVPSLINNQRLGSLRQNLQGL